MFGLSVGTTFGSVLHLSHQLLIYMCHHGPRLYCQALASVAEVLGCAATSSMQMKERQAVYSSTSSVV